MSTFRDSVRRGVGNLANFSGRDRPKMFWPYAGLVLAVATLLSMLISVPLMIEMVERTERIIAEQEELARADPYAEIQPIHPGELIPDLGAILLPSAVIGLLTLAFLAAAVARRLHDRDKSGWWGLLPIPFLIVQFALLPGTMGAIGDGAEGGAAPDMTPFLLLTLNNLLYLGALGFLVYQLVVAGTRGPNRYGADPVQNEAAR